MELYCSMLNRETVTLPRHIYILVRTMCHFYPLIHCSALFFIHFLLVRKDRPRSRVSSGIPLNRIPAEFYVIFHFRRNKNYGIRYNSAEFRNIRNSVKSEFHRNCFSTEYWTLYRGVYVYIYTLPERVTNLGI